VFTTACVAMLLSVLSCCIVMCFAQHFAVESNTSNIIDHTAAHAVYEQLNTAHVERLFAWPYH
jgi:hypothetical protein